MTTGRSLASGLALFIVTLLAYIPAMHGGFVWDDDSFLTGNELVAADDGLYRFWFTAEPPDYFPLTSTTLWIEWRLWGMNPTGYHVTNIVLHAFAVVLLWRVIRWLSLPVPHPEAVAFIAAMAFALHPINVESVAWITQRKNTLPMVFYLLAVLWYLRYDDTRQRLWYALALVAFVLALLSKTAVIGLPVVMLLYIWWRRGKIERQEWVGIIPFFALSLIFGLVTWFYQTYNAIGVDVVRDDTLLQRLLGAGWAVWFYLYKILWPMQPTFIYPRWEIHIHDVRHWLPGVTLAVVIAALWLLRHRIGRHALFTLGYFIVMLGPVLGLADIYFMRYAFVADHWQYFAMLGPVIFIVAGVDVLTQRHAAMKPVALAATALACIVFASVTWRYAQAYRDEVALWQDTLKKNPDCWLAYNNMGVKLMQGGDIPTAESYFIKALELNPKYPDAMTNRGLIFWKRQQPHQAMHYYTEARLLRPHDTAALVNIALIHASQNRYDQAYALIQEALDLNPKNASTLHHRGLIQQTQGRIAEAIESFTEALHLSPDFGMSRYQRALMYQNTNQIQKAHDDYQRLLEDNAHSDDIRARYGVMLARLGKADEAVVQLNEATRLNPLNVDARIDLARALEVSGDLAGAIEQYEFLIWLSPQFTEGHARLGELMGRKGDFESAVRYYRQSLALNANQPVVMNNLAWILATEQSLRDPALALQLAQQAAKADTTQDPGILDTLAVAYAVNGEHERAMSTWTQALNRAEETGDTALTELIRRHIVAYSPDEAPAR